MPEHAHGNSNNERRHGNELRDLVESTYNGKKYPHRGGGGRVRGVGHVR